MPTDTTRRDVLKHGAWAVPAIALAAAAPAVAASTSTPLIFLGDAEALQPTGGYAPNSEPGYYAPLYITAPDGVGVESNPDNTPITLTDITVQFFFPQAGLTFANDYPSNGWGSLAADGSSVSNDGMTLYGYTAKYSDTGDLSANGDASVTPFTTQFAWFVPNGTDVSFSTSATYLFNVSMLANGVRHSGSGTGKTTNYTSGSPITVEFQ